MPRKRKATIARINNLRSARRRSTPTKITNPTDQEVKEHQQKIHAGDNEDDEAETEGPITIVPLEHQEDIQTGLRSPAPSLEGGQYTFRASVDTGALQGRPHEQEGVFLEWSAFPNAMGKVDGSNSTAVPNPFHTCSSNPQAQQ
ncbi:hypothetical protein JR316_0005244 [Psilocybe cubensis]|uniref:Uncharacterized protein n=1 Tax=Psilocybe cubensis TaxID=181762 RepID=A0ACB8H623_PSICU|nr:hypothetical protein JR316_0005244 [Psilocybe cubensis]KAH9483142.1 hypothetical protein JR316_0005244 [Psilocybe cubensis]